MLMHKQFYPLESECNVDYTYAVKNCGIFVLQNGIAPISHNNYDRKE